MVANKIVSDGYVSVTHHAVDRFRERILPTLSPRVSGPLAEDDQRIRLLLGGAVKRVMSTVGVDPTTLNSYACTKMVVNLPSSNKAVTLVVNPYERVVVTLY
jgi:hypothetical protein